MSSRATLSEWQKKVGYLPPLVDLLAYDLYADGRAPANAVAEALRTLRPVARLGRTQSGARVPYRTQHAVQRALAEYEVEAFERTERPLQDAPLEQALVELLEADVPSKAYPNLPNKPGKSNWVEKAGGLPSYIERVAKHLFYEKGYSESRAIATAVNWVKKTCATGRTFGGKVQVGEKARAQACNAVRQWEQKKAKSRAKSAVEAHGSAGLVRAAERLQFQVQPIPDQRAFGTRYANRLSRLEGLTSALRENFPLAVVQAQKLLEADEGLPVEDLLVRLVEYKQQTMILMEALGYGPKPLRSRTDEKHKGRFHGMHGVERAARKRELIPSEPPEPLVLPERKPEVAVSNTAAASATGTSSNGGVSATYTVSEAAANAQFEQLHPRQVAGKFGDKPGAGAGAAPGQAAGLADAIRDADPQFKRQYAQTERFVETHPGALKPTQSAHSAVRSHLDMGSAQIQSIGYSDDKAGVAQFQKDNGMPVTGKLDADTLATINTVYRRNVERVLKHVDFTGIKGPGARADTKSRRKRLQQAANELAENDWLDPIPTGWHHANEEPWGGPRTRQDDGDDFNFDEPGVPPPALREGQGTLACETCVHFTKKITVREGTLSGCMKYSWPVARHDVCDNWLTLTPADATLKVHEARLQGALDTSDPDEILAARAALKVVRARTGALVALPHPADKDLAAALVEHGGWTAAAQEAVLTAKKRKSLPKSAFAIPPDKYPIHDEAHARNALSRVAQHGSEEEKKKVRAAVKRRYPHIGGDGK